MVKKIVISKHALKKNEFSKASAVSCIVEHNEILIVFFSKLACNK